jgi:mannose-6-phosphate isomerase-like protein (cupin superfamily)
MKRHPALISLSHDHHHALVEARRLRRAADADDPDSPSILAGFADFFATVTVPHFREEEEALFPLVVDCDEARPFVAQALLEHQQLRAQAAQLEHPADARTLMRTLAALLKAHVRFEERRLFPLIEELAGSELEHALGQTPAAGGGPVWGEASEDLNATLLAWHAGSGPPEHINDERDVLVFVAEGSATVSVDEDDRLLRVGEAVIIRKGQKRRITAGAGGVRYLSVHRRRPPLQIEPAADRSDA